MKQLFTGSFLACSLLLLTSAAQAQVRFSGGPLLGLSVATADFTLGSGFLNTSEARYRAGFEGGLSGSLEVSHFALQPAVLFCQEGYVIRNTYNAVSTDNDMRLDYVKLPLSLAYMPLATGQGIRVFAGGYVSFLQGGKQTLSSQNSTQTREVIAGDEYQATASTAGKCFSRSVDTGLQAGLGYRVQSLLVQASYSYGLRNVNVSAPPNVGPFESTAYNRSLHLSLAYLFSVKN
jgi:hypothetical protein